MTGENKYSRIFTRRAVLLGAAQAGLFTILVGRLCYLQILQGDKYRTLAEDNRINLRFLVPPRGQIVDRTGIPLAVNQQNYRMVMLSEQVENIGRLLDKISLHVDISAAERKRIERDFRNSGKIGAIMVRDNLTWDQVSSISLNMPELPGIDIEVGEIRSYPYGETLAHVVGYVGAVSAEESDKDRPEFSLPGFRVGKSGVERKYDFNLRGEPGNLQLEVNAHGRVVRELARREPKPGKDISLNIDLGLQQAVQKLLSKEESAAAVVMDVNTGAVLSLVSHPSYDPNLFTYGISQYDWERLNKDDHFPLLNKAVDGVYAPGSTFKVITALAGMDAGLLDPEATIFCPGYYELGDHKFHCWKKGGHGHVDFISAMAGSCDTYFYDLGRRVGIDRIQSMAKRFGLGQKTGIDMPHERSGLIPGRAWKLATRNSSWLQGETLIAAIGQGYMLASPLQLAVMTARIANGGKAVVPRVVKQGINSQDSVRWPLINLEADYFDLLHEAMSAVVNENIGTAYSSRIFDENMTMAGKTGTSQVRSITKTEREEGLLGNENRPWKERDHALFIGFAPVKSPRYAVAVVVEHGGSGAHTAAPIARDILIECQKRNI